jgi:hypothetical protein
MKANSLGHPVWLFKQFAEFLPDPFVVEKAEKPRQPLIHRKSHFWL